MCSGTHSPNERLIPKSVSEMLNYPSDTKWLIVHADDLGMAHSVNKASFDALEGRSVSSASIMVPCPWFKEAIARASVHPEEDFGLHLTFTSEWSNYRWGPVSSAHMVPSLVDAEGYLWPDIRSFVEHAKPEEVGIEIRSQVERALYFGLKPSHIDSHMFALFHDPVLHEILVTIAQEYHLPVLAVRSRNWPFGSGAATRQERLCLDTLYSLQAIAEADTWNGIYRAILRNLKPGLNQLNVHLGLDESELRAITQDRKAWGSGWRERDFRVVTSDWFKELLGEYAIRLVSWADLSRMAALAPIPQRG